MAPIRLGKELTPAPINYKINILYIFWYQKASIDTSVKANNLKLKSPPSQKWGDTPCGLRLLRNVWNSFHSILFPLTSSYAASSAENCLFNHKKSVRHRLIIRKIFRQIEMSSTLIKSRNGNGVLSFSFHRLPKTTSRTHTPLLQLKATLARHNFTKYLSIKETTK